MDGSTSKYLVLYRMYYYKLKVYQVLVFVVLRLRACIYLLSMMMLYRHHPQQLIWIGIKVLVSEVLYLAIILMSNLITTLVGEEVEGNDDT